MFRKTATAILFVFLAPYSMAGVWDATGFVGVDTKAFWTDGRYPGQDDDVHASILAQPELYWRNDDGDQRISIVGYARADFNDDERSHIDLREAYWGYESGTWDLVLGVNRVFWGVTESRHLVDVINQTDLIEDIDQEDKLGQPMINLNLDRDSGRFGFYVLPRFRERTFPGPDSRLRAALPVDDDRPMYESSAEEHHVDVALRYSHYFGDLDVGAYLFQGTSREPNFAVSPAGDRLIPVYEQMTQFGMDLQYTRDAWLWKFEAIAREARSDSFAAAVAGFEYTFYGIGGSNADLGVLAEVLYDGRAAGAPPTAFDNDVFFGLRLALNDASDTSVLAGVVIDIDTHGLFFSVEAERRLGDSVTAELRLRMFGNGEAGDLLDSLERDDYVQLRLSWFY